MAVTPRDDNGSLESSRYECSSCCKIFLRACDLKKHTKFHERPVKCPYEDCAYHERGFSNEKELDRHINDRHTECPQMYECSHPGCGHKSKRESNLKQHERKKHNIFHQRTLPSGFYTCPFMGCGQCRNEGDTQRCHSQLIESNTTLEKAPTDPELIHQNPVHWPPSFTDNTRNSFISPAILVASQNLAAITTASHSTPPNFALLRSPDHNANLNSEVCRLHQCATAENSVMATPSQPIHALHNGESWMLFGNMCSVPPSIDSTNYSGSCAAQGKGAPSVDRNSTPARKRKRDHENAAEILGSGISDAFHARGGDDESFDGADGDSEYDLSDSQRSPSLPPTEFNNSSRLQCPFKHVNPGVYSSLKNPRHKQCEVERKPISQITRHLTRRHGFCITKNCISSFDAPVFDDIHHPAASLCKNCWKTFGILTESNIHFARQCPPEARKALSRHEKYKLLCDTFCTILPAANSSTSRSVVAQRRDNQPRRSSMLFHVSSAPAQGYLDDIEDNMHKDGQLPSLQAQIAVIDQRIKDLHCERFELLNQVQELIEAGAEPQDPLYPPMVSQSQPNSQATERDVLVGGMDRPNEEGSGMANLPDDAELVIDHDSDADMAYLVHLSDDPNLAFDGSCEPILWG